MKSKHLQNAKMIDSINSNGQNTQNSFDSQALSILSINPAKQIEKKSRREREREEGRSRQRMKFEREEIHEMNSLSETK